MNWIIVSAVASWLLAQVIKTVVWHVRGNRFTWRVAVGTGGMPSSHTSFVCATAFGCGVRCGMDSVAFALGVTLAAVVIYDAMGVRRESGRHAAVINRLVESAGAGMQDQKPLETSLGHRPAEVICGGVLGIAVSAATFFWIAPRFI